MIQFNENLYSESYSLGLLEQEKIIAEEKGIPTSDSITGIEVRLSNVYIIDNHTGKFVVFPGNADLYLINIIISDRQEKPIMQNINGFEKVNDNESLNVDKTVYYWKQYDESETPPSQIHLMTSVIKSKKGLRNVGEIMASVDQDKDLNDLADKALSLLKTSTQAASLILEAAGIIGKHLKNVEDKPLFTRYLSLTDIGGDFNQLGRTSYPASNKYCKIDYNLFIRDKDRS